MSLHPAVVRRVAPVPLLKCSILVVTLVFLGFLATSCCEPSCNQEVHIRAGQGAEGMVPGTVNAQRGQTICWINDDTVTHKVVFTNSPGQDPGAAQTLTIAPGAKGKIKVNRNKPPGSYDLHIDPPANTSGSWPPTEPQVIVE